MVGHVLGNRYEIRGVLGRGGMGEVWLARDLKLQMEVALKAVAPERLGDEGALSRLRAEVRSARAVASPHVCRVYDLIEAEGLECVSMEYVDGTTLRQVLDTRSPLELGEAREIALQLLAGLGAIHDAGLVHRDVKPENVMLTRAGRVVLMDFGIAKAVASGGTVAGTPAYWAPEQAAGASADPRADVFAVGIVLAEMVTPSGVRHWDKRQALWQAVREDPPRVPDTPWSAAIARAVAREPGARYPSAQALARALEDVAHRVTGIEEAQPYPGLAAFTEADAEYFFGREAEVEEVWKRLPHRHLLALVGPSGAGKSSFLRAGLGPAKPEGWAHLVCTPGDAPFVALGQALVTEVSHDTEAIRQLLRFEDADVAVSLFRRWRGDHAETLVIIDQFEELFTLNPPEVQARFASLLSRLTLEADVHVLLSMRDDFLLRCQEYETLRPVFEGLVPLGAPAGDALRRALVQPALKCGYRFEDEALVAEMLQAVEGERGALPLLAFAAASLWRSRDREAGLLTRASHDAIGGVAGALAQHAEATLDRIGTDNLPLVRELFRNLVTAQGTRAVRDVDELLTVFPQGQRADAEAVLRTLIEARLLTSYEAHATEPRQTAGRRVELVHESLLTAWPRLVRWRTEDEGGAQLRDQLRQVAHLWEEKGRPTDLLWTGTSYQEYEVWRSRYPGGLSATEEAFGRAMVEMAGRRRRRRRAVYAALLAAVMLTATGLGLLLRKSVRETRRAETETGQREASQLLALGRLKLADHPNAALAYAIASLERRDNGPARRFAVEALWQGPPAIFLKDRISEGSNLSWSPDGRWLASNDAQGLALFEKGKNERRQITSSNESLNNLGFTSDSRRLVTLAVAGGRSIVNVRTLPELRLERTLDVAGASVVLLIDDRLLTFTIPTGTPQGEGTALIRSLSLDGSTQKVIGRWVRHGLTWWSLDPSGTAIFSTEHGRLLEQRLDALSAPPRVLSSDEGDSGLCVSRSGERTVAVTGLASGEVRIWDVPSARVTRRLKSPADARKLAVDPHGRFLAAASGLEFLPPRSMFLFDLAGPPTAEPTPLLCSDSTLVSDWGFSSDGSWFDSETGTTAMLWNTAAKRSILLGRQKPPNVTVAFTQEGHLLSASDEGILRSWPLSPSAREEVHALVSAPPSLSAAKGAIVLAAMDPKGRFAVAARYVFGEIVVVPLDGSQPSVFQMKRPGEGHVSFGTASLDPTGRFLAAWVPYVGKPELNGIRILDLTTGDVRIVDTHNKDKDGCRGEVLFGSPLSSGVAVPVWLRDGRLVTDGEAGLRVWDLASGTSQLLRPCTKTDMTWMMLATPDSKMFVRLGTPDPTGSFSSLSVFDPISGTTREITTHGNRMQSMALDPSGTILVTGDGDGVVRVGPLTGEEPHLLFGHTGLVYSVAVSPDGRWIASGSNDGTIRLWPMPDMAKPPLHTLPLAELVAKLKSLTNLRAVRDPASDTGWKIEIGPFPGWKNAPIW